MENPPLQAVCAFSAMDYTHAQKINIKLRWVDKTDKV